VGPGFGSPALVLQAHGSGAASLSDRLSRQTEVDPLGFPMRQVRAVL
jgi:hypothetical protein